MDRSELEGSGVGRDGLDRGDLGISQEVNTRWQILISEMEDLADELSEEGFETLITHPGSVSVVTGSDEFGLHVVIPNNEFDTLREWVDDGATFDEFEIYKRTAGEHEYAVVVVTDATHEVAVLYPTYYTHEERGRLNADAQASGEMLVHLRTINRERVTLAHDADEFFS
jgi:hypothetical protein